MKVKEIGNSIYTQSNRIVNISRMKINVFLIQVKRTMKLFDKKVYLRKNIMAVNF